MYQLKTLLDKQAKTNSQSFVTHTLKKNKIEMVPLILMQNLKEFLKRLNLYLKIIEIL